MVSLFRAKVVMGDRDPAQAMQTVLAINSRKGGQAAAVRCDVAEWDDLVSLFELAKEKYGGVDVVIANATISEKGTFSELGFKDGKPVKPTMKAVDTNVFGSLYSKSMFYSSYCRLPFCQPHIWQCITLARQRIKGNLKR